MAQCRPVARAGAGAFCPCRPSIKCGHRRADAFALQCEAGAFAFNGVRTAAASNSSSKVGSKGSLIRIFPCHLWVGVQARELGACAPPARQSRLGFPQCAQLWRAARRSPAVLEPGAASRAVSASCWRYTFAASRAFADPGLWLFSHAVVVGPLVPASSIEGAARASWPPAQDPPACGRASRSSSPRWRPATPACASRHPSAYCRREPCSARSPSAGFWHGVAVDALSARRILGRSAADY